MFDKFTLQNLADKSGGVQTSLLYFLYITSLVNDTMRRCFIIQTSDRMQFSQFCKTNCTHSVNQEDRNKHFLCTTNYRIDQIIKGFHEETSIMSELFSQKNLLLCCMQGNNGLLAKPLKKFLKSPVRPAGSHFNKRQFAVRGVKCLNEH